MLIRLMSTMSIHPYKRRMRKHKALSKVSLKDCILHTSAASLLADINEPITIEETWSGRDTNQWRKANDDEYQSLENMKTWNLVESPANVNNMGNKRVFGIKRNSDNSIERF